MRYLIGLMEILLLFLISLVYFGVAIIFGVILMVIQVNMHLNGSNKKPFDEFTKAMEIFLDEVRKVVNS